MPRRRTAPSLFPLWLPWLSWLSWLLCLPGAHAADVLNIGFFQEWPTPNLVAKADGTYERELGVPVRWIAFDTGTQMSEAFAGERIDIAYSQGLAPFVSAVNAGQPLAAIAVAARYPADDCVVRDGAGIDAAVPASFEGRTVALPLATMADLSFRLMLRALEVDADTLSVIDRIPSDAAVLLVDGEVDMACGFGALAMAKMYSAGEPLLSDALKRSFGIVSADLVSVRQAFLRDDPDLVERFLGVTERANAAWQASPGQVRQVGFESGLDTAGTLVQLKGFSFPSAEEQRTELLGKGGAVLEAMRVAGEVFATRAAPALADYATTVDLRYLP